MCSDERKFWIVDAVVYGDVSSLDGIKNFPSTTASSNAENSNSFSILTKEFLNKPDDIDLKQRNNKKPNGVRNLAPFPTIRVNGLDANNIDNDGPSEPRAYYYEKPSIPFDEEDRGPESTNIQPTTVAPR